jgi:hypothetical protein
MDRLDGLNSQRLTILGQLNVDHTFSQDYNYMYW